MDEREAMIRAGFGEAIDWFLAVAAKVGEDQWSGPGLGEWTVRETVAHAARALVTVEEYLGQGATVEIDSAGTYFAVGLADPAIHEAVAERGRTAGAELGPDPVGELRVLADRVAALVARTRGDAPVATRMGGMTLIEYLRTRVLELTVHTLDVIDAVGLDGGVVLPPPIAAQVTLDVLTQAAVGRGGRNPAAVLRALTGRGPLPTDYNALGPDVLG